MSVPSTQQILRLVGQLVLGAGALSVVAAAYLYPEARLPIVIWLIVVVLAQRPSPRESR